MKTSNLYQILTSHKEGSVSIDLGTYNNLLATIDLRNREIDLRNREIEELELSNEVMDKRLRKLAIESIKRNFGHYTTLFNRNIVAESTFSRSDLTYENEYSKVTEFIIEFGFTMAEFISCYYQAYPFHNQPEENGGIGNE